MHVCLLAGGKIKKAPHAAGAATGSQKKWVIYMPAEQLALNSHASCSAFQPRRQIKSERQEKW